MQINDHHLQSIFQKVSNNLLDELPEVPVNLSRIFHDVYILLFSFIGFSLALQWLFFIERSTPQ